LENPYKIQLSIHRFIDITAKEGDLSGSFFSQKRAVEGTRGHQQVQKGRGENYQSEIGIKKSIEQNNFTLVLEGRIDGLMEDESSEIIEEIKTAENSLPDSWNHTPVLHRAQLICYGALLDKKTDKKRSLRLCYYHLISKKENIIYCPLNQEEIETQFKEYLDFFFKRWEERSLWIKKRDISAKNLNFPFQEFRKGQRSFSVDIYRNIQEKSLLLAQAPTGTGKTMGTLFPAVKAMGEGIIQRILYLTAKTTGREMAREALKKLQKAGLECMVVSLTAKERICSSPDSPRCHGSDCLYARGFYDKLKILQGHMRDKLLWSGEDFSALAEEYLICPFELSMEWALEADVLIGDFNHLFDPVVSLKRFFQREDPITVLVDESHNLPDRVRDLYSVSLGKKAVMHYRRALKDSFPSLGRALQRLNALMLELRKELDAESLEHCILEELPQSIIKEARKILNLTEIILRDNQNQEARHLCNNLFFEIRFFLYIEEIQGDSHRILQRRKGSDLFLEFLCLDPSPYVVESLEKCHSTVFFSATLSPKDYFSRLILGEAEHRWVQIPSPFPPENCLVINRNDIDTRYRGREKSLPAIVEAISGLWTSYQGHHLYFFPSYAYMEQVALLWEEQYGQTPVCQWKNMTLEERETFLGLFDKNEPQIVFSVMGGVFSEGVDLQGDKLSALGLISVGFPSFCLERELMREYFQDINGKGFDYAYSYPGWHRVLQAAGRLIRSETDRGIILMIGQRFYQPFYRSLFPQEWGEVLAVNNREKEIQLIEQFRSTF